MTQEQYDLLDSVATKLERFEESKDDCLVGLTRGEREELLALLECEFDFNKVETGEDA
jgi:hypothetical protein